MSLLSDIKRWESKWYNAWLRKLSKAILVFLQSARDLLFSLYSPVTIIVMTETEHVPRRLNVRFGTLILACFSPFVLAVTSCLLSEKAVDARSTLKDLAGISQSTGDELDAARTAINDLQRVAPAFRSALKRTTDILSRTSTASASIGDAWSPLSNLDKTQKQDGGVEAIEKLRGTLEEATRLLEAGGSVISRRRAAMEKLPSLWPVIGDSGYITTYFGVTSNPFTGMPYLHKGLDISNGRQGDPVLATAGGTVVAAGFDQSYGNMVILRHANGYFTRYGHMQSLAVKKGQSIKQGQMLGKIGNTGLSTGAHVHYEVLLAGKLVDPLLYIDLPKSRLKDIQAGMVGGKS